MGQCKLITLQCKSRQVNTQINTRHDDTKNRQTTFHVRSLTNVYLQNMNFVEMFLRGHTSYLFLFRSVVKLGNRKLPLLKYM